MSDEETPPEWIAHGTGWRLRGTGWTSTHCGDWWDVRAGSHQLVHADWSADGAKRKAIELRRLMAEEPTP